MNRRKFFKAMGAGGALAVARPGAAFQGAVASATDREFWTGVMRRLAGPVLTNLANGTLRSRMPVEQAAGTDRRAVTHLEALGRGMAGISPWPALFPAATPEG